MIRSALLLCAGTLAALCLSCGPAVAPPPNDGRLVVTWPLAVCDADSFANAVQMVASTPPNTSTTPTPSGPIPIGGNKWTDLKAAFALAPPFFKSQLCALDGVFVSADNRSWGLRNRLTGKGYIAVADDLWNGAAHAMSFRAFENRVLKTLLKGWQGPGHPILTGPPDSERTVLAVLAHEYGHVLFYRTIIPALGGQGNFNPNFDNFCDDGKGNFFTGPMGAWATITDEPPPLSRWRGFGEVASAHKTGDEQVNNILTSVPAPGMPDTKGAGRKLATIYDANNASPPNGRWAGFFAAFSPQEDFVETFQLFVLRKATTPLMSLPIKIPIFQGSPFDADIPQTCSQRPVLSRKLGCFQHLLCGDPIAPPCGTTCTLKP
jgi:hypothetical protein